MPAEALAEVGQAMSERTYYRMMQDRWMVWEAAGWRCHYCNHPITQERVPFREGGHWMQAPEGYRCATIDHIVPRSQGGSHGPENIVACCNVCNSRKGFRPASTLAPAGALALRQHQARAQGGGG